MLNHTNENAPLSLSSIWQKTSLHQAIHIHIITNTEKNPFQKTLKSTPLEPVFASSKRRTIVGERERERESAKENSPTERGGGGKRVVTTSEQWAAKNGDEREAEERERAKSWRLQRNINMKGCLKLTTKFHHVLKANKKIISTLIKTENIQSAKGGLSWLILFVQVRFNLMSKLLFQSMKGIWIVQLSTNSRRKCGFRFRFARRRRRGWRGRIGICPSCSLPSVKGIKSSRNTSPRRWPPMLNFTANDEKKLILLRL